MSDNHHKSGGLQDPWRRYAKRWLRWPWFEILIGFALAVAVGALALCTGRPAE